MKAGAVEDALNTFLSAYQHDSIAASESFAGCNIGLLAATLGDLTSAIGFIEMVRQLSRCAAFADSGCSLIPNDVMILLDRRWNRSQTTFD